MDADIGRKIRQIRVAKNISKKELSLSTNIPQGTILKIEAGQYFLWSRLLKIARALEIEVVNLVSYEHNIDHSDERIVEILREENLFLRRLVENLTTNKK